ncbi:PQQ-dependent sugar dehydrogenase [Thermogemmatispora sp.]|uniref:PQQ-dependent sugar dehydrogenase n=1 Tax=Thermogemmatispora sp. TaxID=1968838 RepID=UPI001D545CD0|nr:sorbosone dehydrogenase family protein [Thermogemmatispora sp.]MBX5449883.1 sorbosone dehydrogenase family protein [Thermogemmatispora sp.]
MPDEKEARLHVENSAQPSPSLHRRGRRRLVVILSLVVAVLVVLAALLYSQRALVRGLLTGSHFVGGNASVARLHLPPGFSATVFAQGLSAPRFITFSPDGTLFVAERGTGSIVALPDPSHSGKAARRVVVVSGLDDPTSLVFYQGALYVGEASRVTRFTLDASWQVTSRKVIVPNLPTGGNHVTRTVLIGPDGRLYVSIGSSCNVCIESDPRRATVMVFNLDGSGGRIYARGLRNAVGMAINPWNNQIWVTNNGRDLMGDDTPPETIYALQDGGNYGWPRCQAGDIIDPDYGHPGDCRGVIQPLVKMQAHSAPLGLVFYTANQFPAHYHGLFVAFHGSWNRTVPTGYKVVFIPLNSQGAVAGPVEDFATGWLLNNNDATGRPVGLAVDPQGSLYVSDDKGGYIYRISYTAPPTVDP